MTLKIRHLEIFKAVMEWGSVSRAAERLNCTQPTVSVALANFESEIGFPLFDRSSGQLAPTAAARLLFDEVEQSLVSFDRVKDRISDLRSGGAGHIRIACHGAPATMLLPEAISLFVVEHPEVQIDILVRSSFQVAQRVDNRQIDIGILETPMARTSSVACHLDLPCVCLMTADHPLAERAEVTLTDLARHPLIGVLAGHAIDLALDRAAAEASVQLRRTIHGYLFVTMRRLVAKGIGVAVVDASNAVGEPGGNLVWRPLIPEIRYHMSVVRPSGQRPGAPADSLVACLEEAARRVIADYDATVGSRACARPA